MEHKRKLRAEMLSIRDAMDPGAAARASAAIARRVLDLPAFRESRTIMAYVDVRNEVGTGTLIRAALAGGKRVAVPVTDRERRRLIAARITDYPGDLAPGAYGIPEPREYREIRLGELDCILVPGVAYDLRGYRLGFGGGYYDRLLPRVRHHAVLIGLAYEYQVCDTVHPEPHDQPVHFLVTEMCTLQFSETR